DGGGGRGALVRAPIGSPPRGVVRPGSNPNPRPGAGIGPARRSRLVSGAPRRDPGPSHTAASAGRPGPAAGGGHPDGSAGSAPGAPPVPAALGQPLTSPRAGAAGTRTGVPSPPLFTHGRGRALPKGARPPAWWGP